MENISKSNISDRDIFYFRQRQKNRVFSQMATFFSEEAEEFGTTKRILAERLGRDPAQITRWLSEPNNITLDSISDLLLSMGAEMEYRIAKLSERHQSNTVHHVMADVLAHKKQRALKKGTLKSLSHVGDIQIVPPATSLATAAKVAELKRV
jgi:hypothetical protein